MYSLTITGHVRELINQIIGPVRNFLQILEPEELELTSKNTESDSKEDIKRRVPRKWRRATRVASIQSMNCILITFESERFTDYVGEELGRR